jgi:hypothetical protein
MHGSETLDRLASDVKEQVEWHSKFIIINSFCRY